ncbi:hypothetical protein CVT26_013935 [Gymnopilus dilepis]|uniref:Hydrophobin n=1 Tax=Gymnopilus dilepis TaxID=231916 RepID=A0A409VW12_9AGAR|nr:hypothetical protein CVT26_013935 [Gymnopilus dilepis]
MQFKLSALATIALAALAVATPARRNEPADQCTTGSLQCCQSVEQADDPAAASIIKSLGIVVQDVTALVGLTCDPIAVVGAGSSSCSEQPVCCENNSFNGLIAIGCTPININL